MSDSNTILIVEDNDFVRMQIVSFLSDAGFETIEAVEGGAALDLVLAHKHINLAIVDVRMEPMGGFEFIKALRGRDMDLPVILATGDETPDLLEQSQKWGVSAVLIKPVEKDRLIKTVTRTLEYLKRGSG